MEKQIILLEDHGGRLFIHYPDQESEIIPTPNPIMGKSRVMEHGKILANTMTRLVREGYVLKTSTIIQNIGTVYVFEGEVQGSAESVF